jgi:GNAT superfamily N-acetyltransferase
MAINRTKFTCYVAEVDGKVVGFMASSGSRVEELFVHPKHHRHGIAAALFRKAESECRDSVLTVGTTGYGLPFYQAMGMHVTGTRVVTFGPLEGRELTELEKKRPNQASHATSEPAPSAVSSAREGGRWEWGNHNERIQRTDP